MTSVPGKPTLERALLLFARVIAPSRRHASLRVRSDPRDVAREYPPEISSRQRRERRHADADVPRRLVFIQFPERRPDRPPSRSSPPTPSSCITRPLARSRHPSRHRPRARARRAHARRARRASRQRRVAPHPQHQPETLRRPRHRRERRARAHHRAHRAFRPRARLIRRHATDSSRSVPRPSVRLSVHLVQINQIQSSEWDVRASRTPPTTTTTRPLVALDLALDVVVARASRANSVVRIARAHRIASHRIASHRIASHRIACTDEGHILES